VVLSASLLETITGCEDHMACVRLSVLAQIEVIWSSLLSSHVLIHNTQTQIKSCRPTLLSADTE